jgi:hypothetical protein
MNRWLNLVLATSCLLLGTGGGLAASLINHEADDTLSAVLAAADDAQPFAPDELNTSDSDDGASQNAPLLLAVHFQRPVLPAAAPWVSPCPTSAHQQPPARAPPTLPA